MKREVYVARSVQLAFWLDVTAVTYLKMEALVWVIFTKLLAVMYKTAVKSGFDFRQGRQ